MKEELLISILVGVIFSTSLMKNIFEEISNGGLGEGQGLAPGNRHQSEACHFLIEFLHRLIMIRLLQRNLLRFW